MSDGFVRQSKRAQPCCKLRPIIRVNNAASSTTRDTFGRPIGGRLALDMFMGFFSY